MSVHPCVHVVCVCMPLWVQHNINDADLCVAVLPKALAYTLTCINGNGVMHVMQISNVGHRGCCIILMRLSFDVKLDDFTLTKIPELLVHKASIRICGLPHFVRQEHENKTGRVPFSLGLSD